VQAAEDVPVTDITSWLNDRALMSTDIHQHLLRAKQRMKKYADEKHSERQFKVDDWVFLKLQPYVQSSLAARSNQKLAFKFFGPYRVVGRIGSVAYRLELPPSSSVHPVFHVSQLKKAVGARHMVTPTLPPSSVLWSVPAHILQQRQVTKGKRLVQQGLIRWSNLPASLATWEDLEYLQQQFPHAGIWQQPGVQGRGNVSDSTADDEDEPTPGSNATSPNAEQADGLLPDGLNARARRPMKQNPRYFGPAWQSK
jgi:hypothetical protein